MGASVRRGRRPWSGGVRCRREWPGQGGPRQGEITPLRRHTPHPRQRSLRALIDWSHDLCGPDERLLWARLSVFPAAVDLETVEGVCGFGELTADRLLDALDGLVGKSVVVADRDG